MFLLLKQGRLKIFFMETMCSTKLRRFQILSILQQYGILAFVYWLSYIMRFMYQLTHYKECHYPDESNLLTGEALEFLSSFSNTFSVVRL